MTFSLLLMGAAAVVAIIAIACVLLFVTRSNRD
jgi:hypothetical protein